MRILVRVFQYLTYDCPRDVISPPSVPALRARGFTGFDDYPIDEGETQDSKKTR